MAKRSVLSRCPSYFSKQITGFNCGSTDKLYCFSEQKLNIAKTGIFKITYMYQMLVILWSRSQVIMTHLLILPSAVRCAFVMQCKQMLYVLCAHMR